MDLSVAVTVFLLLVVLALWIAAMVGIVHAWMHDHVPGWVAGPLFLLAFAGPIAVGAGVLAGTVPR